MRASQRERDLTVRAALGSSRWALMRQMFVESVVIAGAGAALGVGLAWAGVRALVAIGPENLNRLGHVGLNPTVLAFSAAAAAVAALLFGLVPAIRASRVEIGTSLRSSGRSSALSSSGKWLRNGVVVTEVALAFVLLVGSGLMIRSFIEVQRANPGFDASGVVMLQLGNAGRPTPDERRALSQQLHDRLAAIPSVTAVTAAGQLPLDNTQSNVRWGPEAALADPTLFQQADYRVIKPNYFDVMRTKIIDGRAFTEADNAPGLHRAIVDEVFAKKAFPNESAVGKRFVARTGGPEPIPFEIVGVVQHQRNVSLAADSRETMYVTDGENGFGAVNRWLVRTTGDLGTVAQAARSEVRQLDRTFIVSDLQPLTTLLDRAMAPTRFALVCIGVFAVIAGVLAAVGLYGVLSTAVRQRTGEIGVRMAFGATPKNVFRLVVQQGLILSGVGIVAGVASAFALTRVMRTMVVNVGTSDPVTYSVMAVVFLVVAAVACWLPARRAAGLDPLVALRDG